MAEFLILVEGETLSDTICEAETVVLTNTEGLTDLLVEALRRKDGQTLCDTLENSENQSFFLTIDSNLFSTTRLEFLLLLRCN